MHPHISICIPAYKRASYLEQLLKSIEEQTYTNFEVIITDDSGDDTSVEALAKKFADKFTLTYYKNTQILGTPANWNAAIQLANGTWIKLMHDDDWFSTKESLANLANATVNANFIFSGYHLANADNKQITNTYTLTKFHQYLLNQSPLNLLKQNFIGHPSTTLIKKDTIDKWYNNKVKWVVDIEFYIRALKTQPFFAIKEPLITLGMSESQVTSHVFRKRAVEVPENIFLLHELGKNALKNIFVFDYFWRVWRNLNIRNIDEIQKEMGSSSFIIDLPNSVELMISTQRKIPLWLLKIGVFSKFFMFYCFIFNNKSPK